VGNLWDDIKHLLHMNKEGNMRSLLTLLILVALGATGVFAQMSQPMIEENTTRIYDHVWAIMGFPQHCHSRR